MPLGPQWLGLVAWLVDCLKQASVLRWLLLSLQTWGRQEVLDGKTTGHFGKDHGLHLENHFAFGQLPDIAGQCA